MNSLLFEVKFETLTMDSSNTHGK